MNISNNYEWFEKPSQKLERVFDQESKHLEVGQKNSAAPRFSNPLLGVWISWWNTPSRIWYITSKKKKPRQTNAPVIKTSRTQRL